MRRLTIISLLICLYAMSGFSQVKKDRGMFREYQPGFYQNYILKDISEVEEQKKPAKPHRSFKMDMSAITIPNKMDNYKYAWHFDPVSQGNTGTCWCFSTISMFESEVYRMYNLQIKLSELYIVYWEYVEKARRFVQERGNSNFAEGSEGNAVKRIFATYGALPLEAYSGLGKGRKFHSHEEMFAEMDNYLKSVKANNQWNEERVLETIKSILNYHIGEPPAKFTWSKDNKSYTPQQFLRDALQIIPDDYVDIISIMQGEYYTQIEYEVPDNWWHDKSYHNVPLDVFMESLENAIKLGFTVTIGGDVSEPGFDPKTQAAIVPTFDIPAELIDENARQLRFSNNTTTDDHGIHLVGFAMSEGKNWYLIKDSGAGSRNNGKTDENGNPRKEFGYYFFHEDYVKLKMLDFCVHKDAVKGVLKKFKP